MAKNIHIHVGGKTRDARQVQFKQLKVADRFILSGVTYVKITQNIACPIDKAFRVDGDEYVTLN